MAGPGESVRIYVGEARKRAMLDVLGEENWSAICQRAIDEAIERARAVAGGACPTCGQEPGHEAA